jgi:osmotically-inducible protein OsmY
MNYALRRSVRHRTDSLPPNPYSAGKDFHWRRSNMIRKSLIAAAVAATLLTATGCAVSRGQQTVGAYVDDSVITANVKTKMLDDERVAGTSITVETLNGTVMLSGFAKSQTEKAAAESIAKGVNGVKAVKNEITVRA